MKKIKKKEKIKIVTYTFNIFKEGNTNYVYLNSEDPNETYCGYKEEFKDGDELSTIITNYIKKDYNIITQNIQAVTEGNK